MKIQSPWMGRVRGSAGNMTGCKIYDKNVMRAKAFEVSDPNTAAQQVQRGYFADLIKLVASFSPEQLRTLFPNMPKAMSRRNAVTKQLADYNTMEGNEKVIVFDNIDTLGNAPTMDFGTTTVNVLNSNVIITLDDSFLTNTELGDYYFIAALVNSTKDEISLDTTNELVSDASLTIALPNGWEDTDTIHAIPLITDQILPLTSFGSFIIKRRPSKKSN